MLFRRRRAVVLVQFDEYFVTVLRPAQSHPHSFSGGREINTREQRQGAAVAGVTHTGMLGVVC